jgi:two-component system, sensor histidine kinase LadS
MARFILLCLFLWYCPPSLAQEVVVLRDRGDLVEPQPGQLYFCLDTVASEAAGPPPLTRFVPLQDLPLNLGVTKATVWLKFRVDNQSGQPAYLETLNPGLYHLQLYTRQPDGTLSKVTYGASQPFGQRPVKVTTFQLPLLGQGPTDYYLRVQTLRTVLVPLRVGTNLALLASNHLYDTLFGLYFGFLFIVILYSFYIFFSTKEKLYLSYVASLVCMAMVAGNLGGHSFEYLWPNWPWLNQYVPLMNALGALAALGFTAHFIGIDSTWRYWVRASYLGMSGLVVLAGLANLVDPHFSHLATQFSGAVLVIFIMGTFVWFFRPKQKFAIFFLLARSAYFISLLLVILMSNRLLPYSPWLLYGLHLGLAVEIVILALAMAARIQQYHHATTTRFAQAVEEQEKQRLAFAKQQRQLEDEVRAQTEHLAQAQAMLLAKNQALDVVQAELTTQREELEAQRLAQDKLYRRLNANEQVLKKAYLKLKQSEEKVREQNDALVATNEKMNKSIRAAEVIQQAILPYAQKANLLLKEYFVLLRPRDVVSGDFFWLNKVNGITVLAAVDCTGHGVPGAFMSLIANTLLDKIVRVWQVTDPAEILAMLNEEVAVVLRQRETGNSEGMDVCLCTWETSGDQVQLSFAGAKRPFYYVPANGLGLVTTIQPDRQSVGGMIQAEKVFTPHLVTLEKGSVIYLSTDGFIDQCDLGRVRFGSPRFEALLAEIHTLPMPEQQQRLVGTLNQFQAGGDQRDDILVIGVRL